MNEISVQPKEEKYRIMRLPAVMEATGLARSTIYKKMGEKTFPPSISLGLKSVGWLQYDVMQWIQKRITHPKQTTASELSK